MKTTGPGNLEDPGDRDNALIGLVDVLTLAMRAYIRGTAPDAEQDTLRAERASVAS
jgi:hypothetical protein